MKTVEKKQFRNRAIILVLIWILMLALCLSFLSVLLTIFRSDPQGETLLSASWAGYLVSRNTNANIQVTAINGSWTVPAVNNSVAAQYSSTWIGIGGQLDNTLIQVGTEQDTSGGNATYYAWYETLPGFSVRITTMSVSPGDVVVASLRLVDSATNRWVMQISDATTGQSFGKTTVYNSTLSSGEWIIEKPTVGNSLAHLAAFTTFNFTGCHLIANNNSGSISKFYFSRMEMTNALNAQLTSVSNLTDGENFSAKYLSSK